MSDKNACAAADNEIEKISLTNSIQQNQQQKQFDEVVVAASSSSSTPPLVGRNSSSCMESEPPPPIDFSASMSDSAPPAAPPTGDDSLVSSESALESNGGLGLSSMLQSSPPPHNYRHSRAYRHFKNPPQPHMCIRTITESGGEELFINVLSWTRIVIPQEPSDPIPLYGGMRVPPGNPRSPPIVFAVMANPEVLKDSGRHSKDPEERRAMVELMCDFVEAMNPGVKLVRNAVILKDRDISGELKDVWNAVQAQRDREREEQLMQQRQQQHYHNITTQQMFPKSADTALRQEQQQKSEQPMAHASLLETDEKSTASAIVQTVFTQQQLQQQQLDNKIAAEQLEMSVDNSDYNTSQANSSSHIATRNGRSQHDNSMLQNGGVICSNDQIDASHKLNSKTTSATKTHPPLITTDASPSVVQDNPATTANQKTVTSPTSLATTPTIAAAAAVATPPPPPPAAAAASASITVAAITTPTKKEKLGGFLPNGCIFPRFKNNKHKDKDKEKESKSKDKEKTLLNVLKKSKDKKVAPIEQQQQQIDKSASDLDGKSQYEKNCINLESEVQKLDLNKIDTTTSNDNMFIKLKVAATSATVAK